MRERDLARSRPVPAADQPRIRDGMVWRTKWPLLHEGHIPPEKPADAVDARHIERLSGIVGADDQRCEAAQLGSVGNREDAIHVPNAAVEGEFPDDHRPGNRLVRNINLDGSEEDTEGDRKIVTRALLADVRRGKING